MSFDLFDTKFSSAEGEWTTNLNKTKKALSSPCTSFNSAVSISSVGCNDNARITRIVLRPAFGQARATYSASGVVSVSSELVRCNVSSSTEHRSSQKYRENDD